MQVSAFAGLLIGVLAVGYAAGDMLLDLYDPTVILLAVGGGIAASLVSDGLRPMLGAMGAARGVEGAPFLPARHAQAGACIPHCGSLSAPRLLSNCAASLIRF